MFVCKKTFSMDSSTVSSPGDAGNGENVLTDITVSVASLGQRAATCADSGPAISDGPSRANVTKTHQGPECAVFKPPDTHVTAGIGSFGARFHPVPPVMAGREASGVSAVSTLGVTHETARGPDHGGHHAVFEPPVSHAMAGIGSYSARFHPESPVTADREARGASAGSTFGVTHGPARGPEHGGRHVGFYDNRHAANFSHTSDFGDQFVGVRDPRLSMEFAAREYYRGTPLPYPPFFPHPFYSSSQYHPFPQQAFIPPPPPSATITSEHVRPPPSATITSEHVRSQSDSPPPLGRSESQGSGRSSQSPSEASSSHGHERQRHPSAQCADWSDISEDEESVDRAVSGQAEGKSSFKEAVRFLASACPDAVSTPSSSSDKFRTMTESLASGEVQARGTPIPKESPLLKNTLKHLECDIAGLPYPEDPYAHRDVVPLPSGQFLKIKGDDRAFPSPPPFLLHDSLPARTLHLSGADLRLFSSTNSSSNSSKRKTTFEDSTLKSFEAMARRGLEANSLASSFLDALTIHLKEPKKGEESDNSFKINPNVDPLAIQNLLWAASVAISDSMDMTGRLFFNSVLARRDAALADSALKNPEAAAEMRVLPLDAKRLFGPALETKLKERAEKAKEDRWCMPPPLSSTHHGRQRHQDRAPRPRQGLKRGPSPHRSGPDSHNAAKKKRFTPKHRNVPKSNATDKKSFSKPKKSFQ